MPSGKGMIPTSVDDSESEDDPTLDGSGVPFPVEEPRAASSAASSSGIAAATDYVTDVSRSSDDVNMNKNHPVQRAKTDAEHIRVVAEITLRLEIAEIHMATMREEQKKH